MNAPVKLPRVRVQVTRDMASPVSDVFLHELPILRAAHGQQDVKVVEALEPREIESHESEWDRMHALYRRLNENPVLGGYPGGESQFFEALTLQAEQLQADASQQAEPQAHASGSRRRAA